MGSCRLSVEELTSPKSELALDDPIQSSV